MGFASQKPDQASESFRPNKAFRGNTRYTGNLVAFRQETAPAGAAVAPKRRVPQRSLGSDPVSTHSVSTHSVSASPVSRKPVSPNPVSPGPVKQTRTVQQPVSAQPVSNTVSNPVSKNVASHAPAESGLSAESIQSSRQALGQLAANSDSRHDLATPVIRKSTLALAIIGSLSTGALLGSVWPLVNFVSGLQPSAPVGTQPIAATPVARQAPEAQSLVQAQPTAVAPVPAKPMSQGEIERTTDPVAQAQAQAQAVSPSKSSAEALAKEYLVEIDWLIDQNMSLQLEVKSLSEETVELNQELLSMELQVASLEAEKLGDTRTVYNFVDVPIGSDFTSSPESSTVADLGRGNNDIGSPEIEEFYEPVYDSETDTYNQALGNDYSQQEYYSQEEYVDDNIVFSDQATPAFEPETGFYIDQQFVADVYQYEPEAQVVYDPETGFYVNPNFASYPEYGYEEGLQINDYPPIGQN